MSPVSVVLPNLNGRRLLERFLPDLLAALERVSGPHQVLVVDNASRDGSAAWLRERFPAVEVLEQRENLGFGGGMNAGIAAARHPWLLALNTDIHVEAGFLPPLLRAAGEPALFAAVPRILMSRLDGRVESVMDGLWTGGFLEFDQPGFRVEGPSHPDPRPVLFPVGGCALFHRDRLRELGGFDDLYRPFYWEDIDLGWRAWKRGFTVRYVPESVVHHRHRGTIRARFRHEEIILAQRMNQLLFHWKNLHDPRLRAAHLRGIVLRALSEDVEGERGYLEALVLALRRLDEVPPRRRREAAAARLSDRAALARMRAVSPRAPAARSREETGTALRVLHVHSTLGVVGGAESYLFGLLGDLARRGVYSEVAVETDISGNPPAPVHLIPHVADQTPVWTSRERERFVDIVEVADPDVIHLHNTWNTTLVQTATALGPTIRSLHDHTMFCPGWNKEYVGGGLCTEPMGAHCLDRHFRGGCDSFRWPTFLEAFRSVRERRRLVEAHRAAARLVVASRYMASELRTVGFPDSQILVNPYYTGLPDDPGPPPGEEPPLVATLCRVQQPDKGVAELLQALARMKRPCRAVIAGSGRDLEAMRRLKDELGLGARVDLPGFTPHADAMELLARATVVAFPSMWNEPFGIVGLEALARGRPVVAFDVGGVREWLEPDRTGLLVARGDVAAFAAALDALIGDPRRAAALGRAGREATRTRFTAAAHLDRLLTAYRAAVAS